MFILPKIHITIEKWKFNKNYKIFVSNLGNFKTKNKETIKPKIEKGGYLMIPLCNNKQGIVKYIPAHRIVMETWCPRADMWKEKLTVDHLDHNKRNNTTKNLEWVTKEENNRRAAADTYIEDKDKLIQSLRDKLKYLELEVTRLLSVANENFIIKAVGIQEFDNWSDVRKFLCRINPNYINIKNGRMEKAIQKASNNNTKYCGYNWILERK